MKEYTYELHMHSCLSPCGDENMTPNNIAAMSMLNGVQIAALTDHNTCRNCPAFFEACAKVGIIPVAGMELTTAEEIHMVCLFPTLEEAMAFDAAVDEHRMKIKNKPIIFGQQQILNGDDELIGIEENLLITATDLDLDHAAELAWKMGGACFPAHIDKQSNGLIGILGMFPPTPDFSAVEFHDITHAEEYCKKYPQLKDMVILQNSDAHALEQMNLDPPKLALEPENDSDEAVRRSLIAHLCAKDMRNYQQTRQN